MRGTFVHNNSFSPSMRETYNYQTQSEGDNCAPIVSIRLQKTTCSAIQGMGNIHILEVAWRKRHVPYLINPQSWHCSIVHIHTWMCVASYLLVLKIPELWIQLFLKKLVSSANTGRSFLHLHDLRLHSMFVNTCLHLTTTKEWGWTVLNINVVQICCINTRDDLCAPDCNPRLYLVFREMLGWGFKKLEFQGN